MRSDSAQPQRAQCVTRIAFRSAFFDGLGDSSDVTSNAHVGFGVKLGGAREVVGAVAVSVEIASVTRTRFRFR